MTISKTTVRDIVNARGTRFATVKFIKKDGSERTVNGLFRPSSHIIGNAKGRMVSETMKANGYIPIFSVAENSWKCFHEEAVVEIN
ncbi:hypothetical protein CRP6_gp05 [Roseobacter phage CRP-6]|jgi:hypothetical protein|nr:hypothetical protein CRP6_gp05 [Roseobacter phage CRP-6]